LKVKWIYVALGWAVIFPELFIRLAYGITLKPFLDTIGGNYLVGGAVLAGFYVGYMGGNIPFSYLVDSRGYRVVAGEMVGTALGAILFSASKNALEAGTGMFVMGLASAATYTASMKLVVEHSNKYKSVAVGLLETAGPGVVLISGAVLPSTLSFTSWQNVYLTVAAISMVLCVPLLLIHASRKKPESSTKSLLLSGRLWSLSAVRFFGLWGLWGASTWLYSVLRLYYSFSPIQAGEDVTLFGVLGVLAVPASGLLSDLLRERRKVAMLTLILFFSSLLLFPLTPRDFVWLTVSILGFLAFAYRSPLDTIIAEYRKGLTATSMGVANTVSQASQIVVPIMVGAVLTFLGNYVLLFTIISIGPGLAALTLWRLR